jgi:hypothetical protein
VAVRKIIVLVALVAFAAGLLFICGDMAMAAPKEKAKDTTVAPKVETKKAEESKDKVVCKFRTKEDMQEFEKLYVAKQATFGRMGVLQAYFTMEQSNLQELDKQMEKKFNFKMDSSKMYDLNRESMEIKEGGPIPQPPAQQ